MTIEISSSSAEKPTTVEIKTSEKTEQQNEIKEVSRFRTALPQILASTAKNMILLDLGMTIAFPTIVIPALLNNHTGSGMAFTLSEASWFGSIAFICQPLGSIASGIVLEPIGRKFSLMIVNIPHFIGWLLFYSATSTRTIFISNIIMGLGVGFMEAPIITYVGEICEPRLRGILISYSGLFFSLGLVVIYTLGNLTDWQTTAAISAAIPFITFIAITQVPETPFWLLSRGRLADAERSLCWLRGWVKPEAVRKEFQEMVKYSNASRFTRNKPVSDKTETAYSKEVSLDDERPIPDSQQEKEAETKENKNVEEINNKEDNDDDSNKKNDGDIKLQITKENEKLDSNKVGDNNNEKHCEQIMGDEMKFKEYLKDIVRPEMLKPLSLVIAFFFFLNFAGVAAMRPYQIKVFTDLGFPFDPYRATVVLSTVTFVANVLCMVFVKYLGKRRLSLISLSCCSFMMYLISIYARVNESGAEGHVSKLSWWPFAAFFIMQFFYSFGVSTVPWMLVSEIFPYRGRSLASGVAAAISYVLSFSATKTFLGLEQSLSLAGVCSFYATCSLVGFVVMYKYLPETEGRTLEEIEMSFSSKKCDKK